MRLLFRSLSLACASTLLIALEACSPAAPPRVAEVQIGAPLPATAAPEEPQPPLAAASVVGAWSETWGIPGETDVTYHDVYVLEGTGGDLTISCPERPNCTFKRVSLQGKRLLVALENYGMTIEYDLMLQATGRKLIGRAKTSRGTDVRIVWDRQDAPRQY